MSKRSVAAGAAAAAVLALLAWTMIPGAAVRVQIPEGLSARQTAELLAERGVVPSAFAFRALLRATGFARRLKPGSYVFRVHEWPTEIARKLALGLTDDVKVVIPEGFRVTQIAERLAAAGVADAREFEALAQSRGLEGRLFPSTYRFPRGEGARRAAARMVEEFERQIGAAYAMAGPHSALSLEETLTLASIVEREAVQPAERAVIAAVYLNRLRRRMPLQADPTVQYALGYWKQRLSKDDLKVSSPYNTYQHPGLPPGPICSPGLGSFQAALHPAQSRALYFVADAHGGHIFSETNEEHAQARLQYKRELRKLKARQAPGAPAPR